MSAPRPSEPALENPSRRAFVRSGMAMACGVMGSSLGTALGGCVGSGGVTADGRRILDLQLGWLLGANQLGEVVASQSGYFADEGVALRIHPGGPNIDGVAIVAAGRYAAGAATSSPSIMLAVARGIPIRAFAVAMQEHPYAYFSLPENPVREPADLVGKTVGIQPTGRVLLDALLARHGIDPEALRIQVVGSSMVPLLTGQVDVITGWTTNAASLRPLGDRRVSMRLWDAGIELYAWPYYATARTLREDPELLAAFLRAAGRGWEFAHRETERAVRILTDAYPILRYEDELAAARRQMPYVFNAATAADGWGTMSAATWAEQIATYDRLGQFSDGPPALADLVSDEVLRATRDARPRLGGGGA